MPFEIQIENDGATIFTRYFGLLTTAEITEAYERRFTDPEMVNRLRLSLADYSDVTDVSLDDINVEELAEIIKKASSYNPNVVIVGIMPKPFLFGLGRMWQAYVNGMPWKESIVPTRDKALAFIYQCNAHLTKQILNALTSS